MIGLKEAIEKAKTFIVEINGEQEQFQIEDISLSDDKRNWFVTLSYMQKIGSPNQLQTMLGLEGRRTYKKVVIDNESKEIIGMYNWAYEKREAV
jgi:hypothetical protein